jgi:hypothetical protein
MSDISQEAKAALANVARQMATDRLRRDGAYLMNAVRRRVRAFAQERNLPPADFAKLMHKRMSTKAFMAFCKAHKVSADWLLCGDLKGLQRMTKEAKAEPAPDQAPYRAPAPIDEEAQPAAAGLTRETAAAVTDMGAGS